MTTTTAPAIQIGEHRTFTAADRELMVTRTAAGYVVTVEHMGRLVECYTRTFDNPAELPAGTSLKRAAFEFMLCLYRDFTGVDTTAAIAALTTPVKLPAGQKRTATSTALSDPLFAVLQAMNVNGGSISPRTGCSVTQLRALRDKGLADLEYAPGTTRIRRAHLTGTGRVRLNTETAARRTTRTQTLAA